MVNYLRLPINQLKKRSEEAFELLNPCRVCPRQCGVNRQTPQPHPTGFCGMGKQVFILGAHSHFGEERVLVGSQGSGTVFFTSCNLTCVYCQNWEISQGRIGSPIPIKTLAQTMLGLQNMGCHNINLVSPTIWVPQILQALVLAVEKGLKVPIVYNSGGYDSIETLKLLDGIVCIYMPDIKYSDSKVALKYSLVPNYWEVVQKAIVEMHRQVGNLRVNGEGLAKKGVLIRHLVLPNNLAGTSKIMEFLANLSKNTYINVMDQYYPYHKACEYPELNRRITPQEFQQVIATAQQVGLHRFDQGRSYL